MRKLVSTLLAASAMGLAMSGPASAHDGIEQTRRIEFPDLQDGRHALAVDLHTHSVFSDGYVWPDIRVQEAKRDGLFAMAVSEHLEYQPKIKDIPHPDRNRSYELASAAAAVKPDASGLAAEPLAVINGSEITKITMPAGHINAVFIQDANALVKGDALTQLKEARKQGAFVFWNHPYWLAQQRDGVAKMTPFHEDAIRQGLIQGIEVANGADMSDEAMAMALKYNLTMLGTSDIHGLIDWDYDLEHGAQRTATLVLAKDKSLESVKSALQAGDTVAVYNHNLIGRPQNVEAVVRGSLKVDIGQPMKNTTVVPVQFTNDSPINFMLQTAGPESFYDEGHVFTVKAHSSFTVLVKNVPDISKLNLTVEALNTYVAPREHLTLTLVDPTPGE
ncbi:MAG: Sb-PDE family phosphodiesterase [Hyphomonadaceae bacterium]